MDDANLLGLIASAILERPTCLLCLATKADAPMPLVVRAVDRIGKTATVSGPSFTGSADRARC